MSKVHVGQAAGHVRSKQWNLLQTVNRRKVFKLTAPAQSPIVHSMFWDNIHPSVVTGQQRVFEALSLPFQQHNANRVPHGDWMDEIVRQQPNDTIIVFCDIDAFPITLAAYRRAIDFAQRGGLFGLAQFSNHKPTTDLYVGPMFMAFSKLLWLELGRPSLKRNKASDAGEALTLAAHAHNKPVCLVKPTSCLAPKWALKDQGVFGIGTFYGDCEYFHLFEAREPEHEQVFSQVVEDVVAHRPLRFGLYLQTMHQHSKPRLSFWERILSR